MRKIKRNLTRLAVAVAVGVMAAQTPVAALTNNLASVQAVTGDIEDGADTGVTIGLGLLGLGLAIGGLGWGLKAAFKKRPT